MTNLMDNICKARDFLQQKDIYKLGKELPYKKALFQSILNEVHRHINRKTKEYDKLKNIHKDDLGKIKCEYQLDFTSKDLRDLAADIRNVFKRWDSIMNPEKTIKSLKKQLVDTGKLDMDELSNTRVQIMSTRLQNSYMLIDILNLLEFHSVFLYFLEIASNDEFALKFIERL